MQIQRLLGQGVLDHQACYVPRSLLMEKNRNVRQNDHKKAQSGACSDGIPKLSHNQKLLQHFTKLYKTLTTHPQTFTKLYKTFATHPEPLTTFHNMPYGTIWYRIVPKWYHLVSQMEYSIFPTPRLSEAKMEYSILAPHRLSKAKMEYSILAPARL